MMRDRGGSTAFTKDQVAAALGHAVTSGAFAAKMHAARMFGLVEASAGRFKVTQLGFDLVDPDSARASAARVEAFLRVPLYKRTYEEYRGKTLPARPHGLERVFIEFGVAPKRGGNARLAFERSARQAGFYEHGDDRLVAPLIAGSPEETEKLERGPDLESGNGIRRDPRLCTTAPFNRGPVSGTPRTSRQMDRRRASTMATSSSQHV